jgi:hypothetical protein
VAAGIAAIRALRRRARRRKDQSRCAVCGATTGPGASAPLFEGLWCAACIRRKIRDYRIVLACFYGLLAFACEAAVSGPFGFDISERIAAAALLSVFPLLLILGIHRSLWRLRLAAREAGLDPPPGLARAGSLAVLLLVTLSIYALLTQWRIGSHGHPRLLDAQTCHETELNDRTDVISVFSVPDTSEIGTDGGQIWRYSGTKTYVRGYALLPHLLGIINSAEVESYTLEIDFSAAGKVMGFDHWGGHRHYGMSMSRN